MKAMSEPLDLKTTVNLPKTDFPLKGNLAQNEPLRLQKWEDMNLYEMLREARKDKPLFVLHDGPPYANGNLHVGHALNKTLKDFVIKSRSMLGHWTPYIPGWDCHGLPIENAVEKKLKEGIETMSTIEIRKAARAHADHFVKAQCEGFKRFGIFGEWDNPYVTMHPSYQANIVRAFGKFVEKDAVYKGLRPVHWCISCQTALAEAEVEYQDHTSYSVYVKFPFPDAAKVDAGLADKKVSIVIWTTTPWTLPANLGISLNPGFEYSAIETNGEVLILASGLLEQVAKTIGLESYNLLATYSGEKFDRLTAKHPFIDRDSLLMLGDHVTLDAGTGAVHTAPGHGYEDFLIGRQYGLEVYNPVDSKGFFMANVEHFAGKRVVALSKNDPDGNKAVVAHLESIGALLKVERFQHSYPHCWRCKNPVIFRATPQWFISMNKSGLNQQAIDACDDVKWYPAWGNERMKNMFRERPDWNISRQRAWGVPIIAFYCEDCGEALLDSIVINHVANLFEQASDGADIWYERETHELIPPDTKCKCGSSKLTRESDILDVWFDSGTSSLCTLEPRGLHYPADVYLEGGDQFRGWFNSSLVVGLAAKDAAPYRIVITYGWAVDEHGKKMSKSQGDALAPEKFTKQYGADILRLWCGALNYYEDMRIGQEIINRLSDSYRKIRNTARYCLGNLDGFDPATDKVAFDEMVEIDRWALSAINEMTRECLTAYQDFEFTDVYQKVYHNATVTLSALYFDIIKDRLYTTAPKSLERRSAQSALYEIVVRLSKLIAPLLVFTADEIWENIPGTKAEAESVHLTLFPAYQEAWRKDELLARYEKLFGVRDVVMKSLEEARNAKLIGAGLEAKVTITADADTRAFLESFGADLRFMFIVSQVTLQDGTELKVDVAKADGEKCERCWNYTTDVGVNATYAGACGRCARNIEAMLKG
jgi:isoleucyl-tRNA synthetase